MTVKKKQTDETADTQTPIESDAAPASTTEANTAQASAEASDDASHTGDNGAVPAAEFEASGAPAQVVADVDPSHPAVDNDPRAATTEDQNRIDFNDPGLSGSEAVERALSDQAGKN